MAELAKMIPRRALTLFLTLLFTHCLVTPASAAQREQGVLEIQIKDHRDAIGDFAKLNITIEKFSISPKPGLKILATGLAELKTAPHPHQHRLDPICRQTKLQEFSRHHRCRISFDAFHLKIKTIDGL